ncbi:hypothetical protein CNMCM5793_009373 [Aspergillus hiratsukae]|uniref:HMA domain-containing protein n=1 Tax=Aspergillus hiratsukae TaxID=1194566 RepID=A0A8H6UFF2_9EURO|nr:hypothetical protein CNMCM5793_009373 [Aspergillus hiratsukae]KAF7155743.1 hypothetical protein CNMCM6106_007008 [Aspergillus hiratsukae]KAF7155788.1 hypothetical protein CNMCM6106_007053 [Aspergillus hiratsukae]
MPCGSTAAPPPCGSSRRLPPPEDGCCADGGWCDDVCIEVAASYECSHASHLTEADRGCEKACCSKAEQTCDGRDDCCSTTRVKAPENACTDQSCSPSNHGTSAPCAGRFDGDDTCGGQGFREADNECEDFVETEKDNSISKSGLDCQSQCCSPVKGDKHGQGECATASRDKNADVKVDIGCQMSCCDKPSDKQECKENDSLDRCKIDNDGEKCCASKVDQADRATRQIPPGKQACAGIAPFRQACASHLRLAFEKYSSYLESGRCICRNVLSQANVCCDKEVRSAAVSAGTSSSVELGPSRSPAFVLTKRRDALLDKQSTELSASEIHSRCSIDVISDKILPKNAAILTKQPDPEMAAARETVRFSVTGMTCTGCSNKALKTLNSLDGISRAEVVFISSMGEVDLDPHVTSAETVLRQLERETGFSCTRIVQDEQVLDVIMPAHSAKQLQDRLPTGIRSITKAGRTYSVAFDPVVIGARSVLSAISDGRLAPPQDASLAKGKKELQRLAWSTGLATAFTVPILVLAWADISASYPTRSITSLVLATVVQAIAVPEFYVGALRSLIFSAVVEMDMLVVISITAAYGYSVVAFALTHAGHQLEQGEFFETSSLLITLVLLGRLIAGAARAKAVSTVSLTSLQAETAFLVHGSGECQEIDARLLQLGDTILVRQHSRIVTDGVIIKGTSSVDESMLTGESLPVPKGPEDPVIAGTMNGPGPLTVRLTRLPGQNSISDIARLVEDAIATKPRVQDLADKIAGWFIPVVVGIAIIVFVIWIVIALKIRGKNAGGAVGQAITYSIAVLAISCPCALGLAVPMVLVITGGVAARAGVVVKQADATERAFKVTDVVFDKTGTLTTGVLEVVSAQNLTEAFNSEEVSLLVYASVKDSNHPVALAVRSFLQQAQVSTLELESIETIPGAGTQALWKGMTIRAGNPYWLGIEEDPSVIALAGQGMTLLCVMAGPDILAVYGLKSVIRQEATDVVAKLHRKGITCHIVSGDGYQAVKDTAFAVGIPPDNITARRSPAEKQQYVKQLMDQGKTVLFCGDGTNDAVAIAQATVGVQIGSASDVTRAAADVVLLGGLDGILILLDVSRRAFNRIVFNFVWSAVYNHFAILLAAGAFVKFRVPPAYAGVGEVVSVLPVIIAALSLAFIKRF